MRDLLIPLARRESDGRRYGPDAPEITSARWVCPECNRPVFRRSGSRYRPHFVHAADTNCSASAESLIHLAAKEIIAENGFVWLPKIKIAFTHLGVLLEEEARRHPFVESEAEVRLKTPAGVEIIPDLVVKDSAGHSIAIEITYRHPTGAEKIQQFPSLNLPCLELDLSQVTTSLPMDELRRLITECPSNYRWLFNRKIDRLARKQAERERTIAEELRQSLLEEVKDNERKAKEAERKERELKKRMKREAISLPVKWRFLPSRAKRTPHVDECPKGIRSAKGHIFANASLDCRNCDCYCGVTGPFPYFTAVRCGWFVSNPDQLQALAARTPWWVNKPSYLDQVPPNNLELT